MLLSVTTWPSPLSDYLHGDPLVMTQALNDSLEAVVRQNIDQWFWIHRRWK